MNILIAGIDSKLCHQIRDLLSAQGHQVQLSDPSGAARAAADSRAALVVVDGVPSKDAALSLVRALRAQEATRRVPILQVDPRGTLGDVVELLDAGADDYLMRPFNGQVFLARVRTLLRRQIWSGALSEDPVAVVQAGGLTVRLLERVVLCDGQEVLLTRLEFDLLSFFARNRDKALKRTEILEAVWKYPEGVETRTLDKHVETLRRKLGAFGQCIRTVHGVGYRFSPAPADDQKLARAPQR
ncbi:MAG: response regulator transcription factor [Elusimicrobiota bacterium]